MKENTIKETLIDKESRTANTILGTELKSISELRVEQGISCTINQFLTFGLNLTDNQKTKLVKGQLPKKDGDKKSFTPWFSRALGPIKRSLENHDKSPIYAKLSELRAFEFDDSKRNERADVSGSIEALDKFLNAQMPEPFNHVRKTRVQIKNKSVVLNGVKIKVMPDLVFTTKIGGVSFVGAVKILLRKGKPLGPSQMKLGAHILHQYVVENEGAIEGEVKRELCVFIDVFHDRVVVAPDRMSAPQVKLRTICNQFSDLWMTLISRDPT